MLHSFSQSQSSHWKFASVTAVDRRQRVRCADRALDQEHNREGHELTGFGPAPGEGKWLEPGDGRSIVHRGRRARSH